MIIKISSPVSGQIWPTKSEFCVSDIPEHAEFTVDVYFFCFWLIIPFLGKFGQKIRIVSGRWNVTAILIRIWRIRKFGSEIPFLDKFGLKIQNCLFRMEVYYLDQFQYAEFHGNVYLSCSGRKIHSLGKFGWQNCLLKMKLCA